MKKMSMAMAVSSIALVAPGLAAADAFNYVSAKGGITFPSEAEFNVAPGMNDSFDTGRVNTNFDSGFNFGAAFGRQYNVERDFSVRTELELGYSKAELDSMNLSKIENVSLGASNSVPRTTSVEGLAFADGDLEKVTGFVSIYGEKDLTLVPNTSFIFGTGIGGAQVRFDEFVGRLSADGFRERIDDEAVSWAFHVTAGWSYWLTDRIALEATYRYMSIEDVDMESVTGLSKDQRIDTQRVNAGIRFGF